MKPTLYFYKMIACVLLFPIFSTLASAQSRMKYLALGDSYTIGESVEESKRWPVQLSKKLNANGKLVDEPVIIATTGWRTDNLKNAVESAHLKNDYELVSLLIGVNNQFQGKPADQYALEFEDLVMTAIKLGKGLSGNVFVVSIPDYGYTPYGKPRQVEISTALDEFNEINARIANRHGVKYFYITDISRRGLEQTDLVAADGLHPSGKMYELWVERIARGLIGQP
jgi:lysophospholipase L1-like esterase